MAISNFQSASIGLNTLTSLLAQRAETDTFIAQLEAQTSASILNAGNRVTSFEFAYTKNLETIDNINQVLGDKLSERSLTAIKEVSLLKAAAAETGTTGGTTDFAIQEAYLNEHFDKANIVSSAKQQKLGVLAAIGTQANETRMAIDTILSGGISYSGSSLVSSLHAGLNITNTNINYLTGEQKMEVFGIKPEGAING